MVVPLDSVKPNDWNPNEMTEFQFSSLREGLRTEGWLKSDSMLVWGKDKKGKVQNLIINGEHRHDAAVEIGMKEGPAVFLNGITRAEAMAFTIKLDNRRGGFNQELLVPALREINLELGSNTDLGLSLGFTDEVMMRYLQEPATVVTRPGAGEPGAQGPSTVHSENPHVKTVPLFFSPEQYARFDEQVKQLGARFQTDNITDTVIAALEEACKRK